MKEIGIYIHIPFCKRKCYYCDFLSFCYEENNIEKYIVSLKNEIESFIIDEKLKVKTIYIGGGTPSFIDSKYIKELLGLIKSKFGFGEEITIEVNPGTVTEEKLKDYLEAGINRLSIGMQSANNILLEKIGRIHTYEQFEDTYKLARKVGFKNINVDVMFGLPSQTTKDVKDTLKKIIDLNPEHISTYSLILEEGTKLYNEQNKYTFPNDIEEREMYHYIISELKQNDYIQYEISNFAKKGYYSKHNVDCWNQHEYLGFGLGAHSYYKNIRYNNTIDFKQYIENKNIHNICEVQKDNTQKLKERIMLGLRLIEGISISDINREFGANVEEIFKIELEDLKKNNLIEVNHNIKLTPKGLDFANIVWEKFV